MQYFIYIYHILLSIHFGKITIYLYFSIISKIFDTFIVNDLKENYNMCLITITYKLQDPFQKRRRFLHCSPQYSPVAWSAGGAALPGLPGRSSVLRGM